MHADYIEQVEKLYFQVMIVYGPHDATADIPEDERELESAAIDGFEKAEQIAHHTIHKIHTKFPTMNVIELELDQAPDGYHLLVVNDEGGKVAKVGLTCTDYTNETIH